MLRCLLLAAACCATAVAEDPRTVLRSHGLAPRGSQWELQQEQRLRRELESLQKLQQDITAARRKLTELAQQNAARWSQVGPRFVSVEKKLKSLPTDHKDRRQLQQQLNQLKRQATPLDELAGAGHVVPLVKQLIDWELSAAAKLRWCRGALLRIRQQHEQVSTDAAVDRALQAVGQQLGSLDRYRDADEMLDGCDRLVHRRVVPLYREGGHWRVGVLINGRWPATVSWLPEGELLLLPASLADAIGARPDPQRSAKRLQAAKSRTVTAQPIIIDQLRIGRVELTDVPAWSLPPEAEDLGIRCGQYALPGSRLDLQPQRLHAVISRVR